MKPAIKITSLSSEADFEKSGAFLCSKPFYHRVHRGKVMLLPQTY